MMIYLARWNKETNKQRRTTPFLSIHLLPGHVQTDTVIFSEFNWKIVFSKITSRISKPLSVFDKLGLGSKYRGGRNGVAAHRVGKMQMQMKKSQGMPKLNHSGDCHPQPGGKKERTVN